MQKTKNRIYKRLLGIAIVLCVLFTPLTTSAFWEQEELRLNNGYSPDKYSTKVEEIFESPVGWLPGERIKGEVLVVNDGKEPVFAKAVVNFKWFGQDEFTKEDYELTFVVKGTENREYAALITWGEDVVLLSGGEAYESTLGLGLTVIEDATKAQGKWLLLDERPDKNGNLTFYYVGVLGKGEKTSRLIDSVQMNPKIEAKTMGTHTTYNKESESWQTEYKINPSFSYENAKFLLTVKVETAQVFDDEEKPDTVPNPSPQLGAQPKAGIQPKMGERPKIGIQPKTGDLTDFMNYIISMSLATVILLGCTYILKRQQKRGGKK